MLAELSSPLLLEDGFALVALYGDATRKSRCPRVWSGLLLLHELVAEPGVRVLW